MTVFAMWVMPVDGAGLLGWPILTGYFTRQIACYLVTVGLANLTAAGGST